MSKYTTELRYICEHEAGLKESVGYKGVSDVIKKARPKVFDFSYPIFDAAYKPTLETKILKHFYTREIGLETYGLWKLKLDTKMNEIMPYYNKLYKTELIEFNPLYDTDIHVEGHRDEDVKQNGNSNSVSSGSDNVVGNTTHSGSDVVTSSSEDGGTDTRTSRDKTNTWDLYSDTPQGGINGIVAAEDDPALHTNAYLTNARHVIGDTDGSTGSTVYGKTTEGSEETEYGREIDSEETTTYGKKVNETNENNSEGDIDYAEHVYGYRGANPSKSLMEFRNTLLNIDMMVIDELEELFFQLW